MRVAPISRRHLPFLHAAGHCHLRTQCQFKEFQNDDAKLLIQEAYFSINTASIWGLPRPVSFTADTVLDAMTS